MTICGSGIASSKDPDDDGVEGPPSMNVCDNCPGDENPWQEDYDMATRATTVPVYTIQGSGTAMSMGPATRATRVRQIRTTHPSRVRIPQIPMEIRYSMRATTVRMYRTHQTY